MAKQIDIDGLAEFKKKCDETYAKVGQGGTGGGTSIEAFTIVNVEESPFELTNDKFYNSIKQVVSSMPIPAKPLIIKYQDFYLLISQENFQSVGEAMYVRMTSTLGWAIVKYIPTSPFVIPLLATNDKNYSYTDWFNEQFNFNEVGSKKITLKQGITANDIYLIVNVFGRLDYVEIQGVLETRRLYLTKKSSDGYTFKNSVILPKEKRMRVSTLSFEGEDIIFNTEEATFQ